MIRRKVEGEEVTTPPPAAEPRAQVIDLMDALQKSLARAPGRREAAAKAAPAAGGGKKPLAAKTKRAEPAPPARKAQGGRK